MSLITISLGNGSAASSAMPNFITGISVAVLGGLFVFLLNWGREWLTAYLKKKSEAEVLAFSLVNQLDRLIAGCSDVVDDPLYEDKDGYTRPTAGTPEVQFPDDWNWAAFPKKLQYQIRSLPNKIDAANRSVSHLYEYGDGPPWFNDAFEEREWRYAWIGLEAVLVNDILADKYGVPVLDRGEWDPTESFKSKIDKLNKKREADKAAWQPPDFMLPEVPIEELEKRRAELATALDAAKAKVKVRT